MQIKSGLDGGEKLVMSAPPELYDGSKIKIANDHNKHPASNAEEAQR